MKLVLAVPPSDLELQSVGERIPALPKKPPAQPVGLVLAIGQREASSSGRVGHR